MPARLDSAHPGFGDAFEALLARPLEAQAELAREVARIVAEIREEGDGALTYLCIWELEDGSPLQSRMYQEQNADPTALYLRVNQTIKARTRGLYRQIYPETGAFEDRSGFHPRHQEVSA